MTTQEFRQFSPSAPEKERIAQQLAEKLKAKPEVRFAFVYGSFLRGTFRDIDVGVFLEESQVPLEEQLEYQLNLLEELSPLTEYPLDVRVINGAPLAFRYNVTCGRLLFTRDEALLAQFIERTRDQYFDFLPVIEKYLEEFARG